MNTNETFREYLSNLPLMLTPKTMMTRANEPIIIHNGVLTIKIGEDTSEVNGNICFTWMPEPGVRITAVSKSAFTKICINQIALPGLQVVHGNTFVIRSFGEVGNFKAFVNSPFLIRSEQGEVDSIYFELPNFRNFIGEAVRYEDGFYSSRLFFHIPEFSVVIDQLINQSEIIDDLKEHGGYRLTCTGKISSGRKNFSYEDSKLIVEYVGLFLTFLNGRRAYPCLLIAEREGRVIWKDYSAFFSDSYKDSRSWLPQHDHTGIQRLWVNFWALVQDKDDKNCIDYLIHWYIEANNNSAFAEGSIVLLQNAFELLFNWQIVEKKGLITKAQLREKRLNADAKIRMLFKEANIDLTFPIKYQKTFLTYQQQFAEGVFDFPKVLTEVRNAIVHSDQYKRRTLHKVSSMMRFHIQQLGLYYLELLILNVLGYQGKVASRASENMFAGGNEKIVPW